MDIEQIKEIIKCVKEYDLEGITIEVDNEKISITNRSAGNVCTSSFTVPSRIQERTTTNEIQSVEEKEDENIKSITSPMVGVVALCDNKKTGKKYSVGDGVKKGEAIFTIEAMKLLNEVLATEDGVIEEILLEDGEIVEYNQSVIKINCKR